MVILTTVIILLVQAKESNSYVATNVFFPDFPFLFPRPNSTCLYNLNIVIMSVVTYFLFHSLCFPYFVSVNTNC